MFVQQDPPTVDWEDHSFLRSVNSSAFHLDSPKAYKNSALKFEGEVDTRDYGELRKARNNVDMAEALELSA